MVDCFKNPVADHNVIPGTWSLKFKRKPDWKISKIKGTIFCKRGYPKEIVS